MFADIVDGYVGSDGFTYVRPDQNITRAQFVKIIVSGLNLKSDGPGKTFKDVKPKQWYSEPIRIASDLGIIHGNTKNQFLPDQHITRAEITKIIVLAFEKTIDFSKGKGKSFTDVNAKILVVTDKKGTKKQEINLFFVPFLFHLVGVYD